MPNSRTGICLVLFLIATPLVGCGFLDEELLLSDEQFQRGLEMGPISTGGTGHGRAWGFGCGGVRVSLGRVGLGGAAPLPEPAIPAVRSPAQMTDEEILSQTEIGVIDETPRRKSVVAGDVAAAYYATKENRDEAVERHFSGP